MKEKNPTFTISGENEEGTFEIIPDGFFGISSRPKKTIITGGVVFGVVSEGSNIAITKGPQKLTDKISRVEISKKEVGCAVRGELVGICLKKTGLRMLRRLNNS